MVVKINMDKGMIELMQAMKGTWEKLIRVWEELRLLVEKKWKRPKYRNFDEAKKSPHDGILEESYGDLHESSHVKDVCIEED